MKKNKLIYFSLLLLFLTPIRSYAISEKYEDKLYEILEKEQVEDKINIYFFYGDGCPHCAKEERLFELLDEVYKDKYNLYMYETWNNDENLKLMEKAKEAMGETVNSSVPFTVIGSESFIGYNDYVGTKIENQIKEYLEIENNEESVAKKYKKDISEYANQEKKYEKIGFIIGGFVLLVVGIIMIFKPKKKDK